MTCTCGEIIPESNYRFPIKPITISKNDPNTGKKRNVKCTSIIVCTDPAHPEGTQYNYVEWARYRSKLYTPHQTV